METRLQCIDLFTSKLTKMYIIAKTIKQTRPTNLLKKLNVVVMGK